MNTPTRIAGLVLVTLLASTSLSSAFGPRMGETISGPIIDVTPKPIIDAPIIDVTSKPIIDAPIIDVTPPPDYTPIDLPANPEDGLIDAVLDGIDDKDDKGDTNTANAVLVLSCVVDGDDLIITNKGEPIPPGTKVKWAAGGDHGMVQLPNGLKAGQKAKIENVLDAGAGKCTAEAVL